MDPDGLITKTGMGICVQMFFNPKNALNPEEGAQVGRQGKNTQKTTRRRKREKEERTKQHVLSTCAAPRRTRYGAAHIPPCYGDKVVDAERDQGEYNEEYYDDDRDDIVLLHLCFAPVCFGRPHLLGPEVPLSFHVKEGLEAFDYAGGDFVGGGRQKRVGYLIRLRMGMRRKNQSHKAVV